MAAQSGSGGAQSGATKQGDVNITLYWLEKSRSQRVLWLLEELKLKYEIQTFHRQNMLAPEEFKNLHPLGKAPVLSIEAPSQNSGKPVMLAESSYIMEYLVDHFGPRLVPQKYTDGASEGQVGSETESWLRYRYFMHYVEGSFMPILVTGLLMDGIKTQSPFLVRPLAGAVTGAVNSKWVGPQTHLHFGFLEGQLATSPDGGPYICGPNITAADFLLSFPLLACRESPTSGLTKERYPKLWAYTELLERSESYKVAVHKVTEIEGKYELI